jgi:hypothetical protein
VQTPSNSSLAESLAWISSNAEEGGAYTITVNAAEAITPTTLSYNGKKIDIMLNGGTAKRTISLSSNGSLFTVGDGVTLTLGNNVTLQGRSDNHSSLVYVNSGGTLILRDGGEISGNTVSSSGGGVYVNGGAFTMSGGEISGNTAASSGGGVYVSGGTFTMSGGEISGNTVSSSSSSSYGGGVYVYSSGTFTMSGGTISGNTAAYSPYNSSYGGGVYVYSSGTFTMSGGTISGNTATAYSSYHSSYGGGVYSAGTFTKQGGGVIYGSNASSSLKNTAGNDSNGHAVYANGKKRNTTANASVNLDSSVSGSAGGWE